MNLIDIVKSRYSTKAFDRTKKIPEEDFDQIKALLRYSPSSVNSQPWHFLIADNDAAKKRMSAGTQGIFEFNQGKVLDASHVILFCVKTEISDEYMQHLLEHEEKDGRFAEDSFKEMVKNGRNLFVNIHRHDLDDAQHWMEKQLYLNMGTVLLGAGVLGLDAVPMEGIDAKALDTEFDLRKKGFAAVAMISLGYRSEEDFNAGVPKSRLAEEEIFTIL